jgi:aminopeptidase
MGGSFDLERFLVDVFDPVPGEHVAVVVDRPVPGVPDNDAWRERRGMAAAWREGLERLGSRIGFATLPLVSYPATGRNGADFPVEGEASERTIPLSAVLNESSLLLALTEFSMTAALCDVCKRRPGADVFRAASMPGVQKWMEQTSLAADYREVARRCRLLKDAFGGADLAEVLFSTGHRCAFDLRHRICEADDGYLHRDKNDDIPVINLPSGETFEVPYEGEIRGDPSRTRGELPVHEEGQTVVFRVEENRIVEVIGRGTVADRYRSFFAADPMRGNVAEVAFGCNDDAKVTGNVLEDEKAGFHWAYGRSDHLGGKIGLASFRSPENVVHQDIVYAKESPIAVAAATLVKNGGRRVAIIRDGTYVLW